MDEARGRFGAGARNVGHSHPVPGGAGQLQPGQVGNQLTRFTDPLAVTGRVLRDRRFPAHHAHVLGRIAHAPGRAQVRHEGADQRIVGKGGALRMPGTAADRGHQRTPLGRPPRQHAAGEQRAQCVEGAVCVDHPEAARQSALTQSEVDDRHRCALEPAGRIGKLRREPVRQVGGRRRGNGEHHALEALSLDRPTALRGRELPDARAQAHAAAESKDESARQRPQAAAQRPDAAAGRFGPAECVDDQRSPLRERSEGGEGIARRQQGWIARVDAGAHHGRRESASAPA